MRLEGDGANLHWTDQAPTNEEEKWQTLRLKFARMVHIESTAM
jgi:hypothetical protein